jgi:hypothetical protein
VRLLPSVLNSGSTLKVFTIRHESKVYRLRPTDARLRDSFSAKDIPVLRWIPGPENLASCLTKGNLVVFRMLNQLMLAGRSPRSLPSLLLVRVIGNKLPGFPISVRSLFYQRCYLYIFGTEAVATMKIRALIFDPYTPGNGPFGISQDHLLAFPENVTLLRLFHCSRLNAKLCCGDDQFPNARSATSEYGTMVLHLRVWRGF